MAKELYEIEDEIVKLNLHPGQTKAWKSEKRFVCVCAGVQSGKTSFGPWWLFREIQRCGGGDFLCISATYDLYKMKMGPELRNVFETLLGIGRFWSSERIIELKNPETNQFEALVASDPMWARIILRSASAGGKKTREGVSGLESATIKAAWLDEVGLDSFSFAAYDAILRRLSLSEGRALLTTTLYNINFLKREVYNRFLKGDPDYDVISFSSIDNPAFPRAEYERARRTLPSWKFNMLYKGIWDIPTGMIYSNYDSVHVVEPFQIPSEWPRYAGIDFGAVHNSSVWIAEDVSTKSLYVYRVTLEGGLSTKQHAANALYRAKGERVVKFTGGSKSEGQSRKDWSAAGVNVLKPPFYDFEPGIDQVFSLLGEKRLFFFDNCELGAPNTTETEFKNIFDELSQYSRKLDGNGEPTPQINEKEKYHRLDALRYAVVGMPQQGGDFFHSVKR